MACPKIQRREARVISTAERLSRKRKSAEIALLEIQVNIAHRKRIGRILEDWHPGIAQVFKARGDAHQLASATSQATAPTKVVRL